MWCAAVPLARLGGSAALHLIEIRFDTFRGFVSRIDLPATVLQQCCMLHRMPCLLRREDAFEERVAVVLERAPQRRAELRRHDELGHIGLWY